MIFGYYPDSEFFLKYNYIYYNFYSSYCYKQSWFFWSWPFVFWTQYTAMVGSAGMVHQTSHILNIDISCKLLLVSLLQWWCHKYDNTELLLSVVNFTVQDMILMITKPLIYQTQSIFWNHVLEVVLNASQRVAPYGKQDINCLLFIYLLNMYPCGWLKLL